MNISLFNEHRETVVSPHLHILKARLCSFEGVFARS